MRIEPLRQGDIVDIVAPASRCTTQELRAAVKELRALGLVPRVPRDLFAGSRLFANSDRVRLAHLKKALYARDSKMIWCVRGGYGAIRLMPEIREWPRPPQPKIFLGYSDITTLHAHFNERWNWPTLHGPLLDRLGRGDMSAGEKRAVLGMIFGRIQGVEFKGLKPLNSAARRGQEIRARVGGGNLAVLQSGLGTPSAFRAKDGILFLEDTGERPHRVDRMLAQARQAGWFDHARAVVFGHFQLSDARDRRRLWNEVMKEFAESLRIPVLRGLPVGHDTRKQYPLPFHTAAVLRTGPRASLKVDSGIG